MQENKTLSILICNMELQKHLSQLFFFQMSGKYPKQQAEKHYYIHM